MEIGLLFVFAFIVFIIVQIAEWLGHLFGWNSNSSVQSSQYRNTYSSNSGKDISDYGINEIKSSGRFSPKERAAEYRRRGKSPSGVIDGVYNDSYRGNDSYNDADRDWDADA